MKNLSTLIKNSQLKSLLSECTQAYVKASTGKPYTIGVMGKSGAGKSSFINALCQQRICAEGHVGGCTREIQTIDVQLNEMDIQLLDFPGIAENEKWSEKYIELYKSHLDNLDLIFWIIKSDDRALLEDEMFYREYLSNNINTNRCIFLISQADKTEPTREWNNSSYTPSDKQLNVIKEKHWTITEAFYAKSHNVVPISVNNDDFKTYNFDDIFYAILFKLNLHYAVDAMLPLKTSRQISDIEYEKEKEYLRFSSNILKGKFKSLIDELNEIKSSMNQS